MYPFYEVSLIGLMGLILEFHVMLLMLLFKILLCASLWTAPRPLCPFPGLTRLEIFCQQRTHWAKVWLIYLKALHLAS